MGRAKKKLPYLLLFNNKDAANSNFWRYVPNLAPVSKMAIFEKIAIFEKWCRPHQSPDTFEEIFSLKFQKLHFWNFGCKPVTVKASSRHFGTIFEKSKNCIFEIFENGHLGVSVPRHFLKKIFSKTSKMFIFNFLILFGQKCHLPGHPDTSETHFWKIF